ncbi:MAG: DUF3828 domain-containing protein [Bacteroidaceae bacterium]|nr:DUF3828 domain-containing protein [Bacteroidaceae bacterium]
MKKIAFIVAFVFATLPAFSQDEKAVEAFLEGIYNSVANISNNNNGDYETLVEKHCSRKFRLYYGEARRWEKKAGECMLHSGGGAYDLFIGCQDYFDSIKFKINNVQKAADERLYTATVAAHFYCEAYKEKEWQTQRTAFVTNEGGEWRIADFQSQGEASDLNFMIKELPRFIEAQTTSDSAMVAARLETIYNEVARIAHSDHPNTGALNEKYLSQQFKELSNEIGYWEEKLGEMIVGKDCWIRTQDWDRIEYNISNIKITSPSKATADVTAAYIMHTQAGERKSTGKTLLNLVYENGNWYIDDFTDYYDNHGLYKWSDSREYKQGILETVKQLDGYTDYLIENKQ